VNSSRTEHLTGQAPVAGDVAGSPCRRSRATVITIAVVTPGLSYLRRSANCGKTWAEITVSSLTSEVSFTSLSYVSPTAGWVVISADFRAALPAFGARINLAWADGLRLS